MAVTAAQKKGKLVGSNRVAPPQVMQLPVGTTTELNALGLGTDDKGVMAYNTTTNKVVVWTGAAFEVVTSA